VRKLLSSMVISSLLVALCCLLQLNLAQTTTDNTQCAFVYGDWSDCIDFAQTRSVKCECGGVEVDVKQCNNTQPIINQECECKWRWSKWSKCTTECGGGNTTRVPVCYCNEVEVEDSKCDINMYFGRETVSCNEYECGDVPALNKIYWINVAHVEDWPIENDEFNCSRGFDPVDSPKGLTYYVVLSDPHPATHAHPEWYFLAKEWIAAKLNLANGAQFSTDGVKVIIQVGDLLENCAGYPSDQIPQVYALKEKLGRLNNNIGGLDNVDSQMSMILGGTKSKDEDSLSSSRLTFILAIAVPLVALLIVAVALGFTIYYVREKTAVAKDKFESEDEEEVNLTGHHHHTDLPVGDQIVPR